MPNVTVTLTGSASGSTLSDGAGNYRLSVPFGGSYIVTPSKAARTPGSAGINTVDVIATQRQFLNLGTPLTGCQRDAADVNGDTVVNTVDVIAIQRFFLGLSTGISNAGKYQFNPTNRSYLGLVSDQTGQNYDTLVFGDVASPFGEQSPPDGFDPNANGQTNVPDEIDATTGSADSFEPNASNDAYLVAVQAEGKSAGKVPLTVAAVALPEVAVDISVTNFLAPVTTATINGGDRLVGFQGDFTFDERVVTFQSEPVQKAGLTAGNWNVSGNVLPGEGPIRTLRLSAYSNDFTPLLGSGTLFELRMIRVSQTAQGTQLLWAALPDHFIFIDADLRTQRPGNAAPGSVTPSGKRK